MQHEIDGAVAPCLRLRPAHGETAWVSTGGLMSYGPGIDWTLKAPGGVSGVVRRMLAGEGVGLTYVTATRDGAQLTVAAEQPGRIVAWSLDDDGPVVTTRGAFMAAWGDSIDINVTVARRAGAALFGGAGLLLQVVNGRGTAIIHVGGDLDERALEPGQTLTVSTGNLAAFSQTVDYSVEMVGSLGKALLGGEGLFMTRLTGPGRVLLQTLKRGHAASKKG